ncbi:MAG: hypothetical protein HY986_13495 [Candidatus Melainabacteria bacterium]|nr:hypothetical protein [Candidatus Melainabacteria bacterium]
MSNTLELCTRMKPIVTACSTRCVAATVTVFIRVIAVSLPVRKVTGYIPAIYAKAGYEERPFPSSAANIYQFSGPTIDQPTRYSGEFLF